MKIFKPSARHFRARLRIFLTALSLFFCPLAPSFGQEKSVEALVDASKELDGASFGQVVEATTGHRLVPVDPGADKAWIEPLGEVLNEMLKSLNTADHSIHGVDRVNEASRFIEDELVVRLGAIPGWQCDFPKTAAGEIQRSGYPDLRVVLPDRSILYLDPKLFAADSRTSSFRAFYYEPKTDTNKINDEARHLLIGIAHAPGTDGRRRFESWELIDVSGMPVRLKLEFQASNRAIYREEAVVARGRASAPE